MPPENNDIQALKEELKNLNGRVDDLTQRIEQVLPVAKAVDNIQISVTKVSQTADSIYSKLAGSLAEKGLIFKQSDLEIRVNEIDRKVNTLWEDRLKLIAGAGAVSVVVAILFQFLMKLM